MLAVSYAFGLSDLHFENIIAAGKHPVLVDVETLFAPRLKRVLSRETQEEIEDSLSAEDFTVLETSILPSSQSSSEPQYWGASNPEGLQTIVEIPLLPKVDMAVMKQDRFRCRGVGGVRSRSRRCGR